MSKSINEKNHSLPGRHQSALRKLLVLSMSLMQKFKRPLIIVILAFILLIILALITGKTGDSGFTKLQPKKVQTSLPEPSLVSDEQLLLQSGNAMEEFAKPDKGGWTYASQIQGQNFQTDRDVGTSSVGMGFLALASRYPNDPRWVDDAKQVASWLMAVSRHDIKGDIWWTDYVNNSDQSNSIYTSFDDGPIGIGDFFWRLYEKTGNAEYKKYALGSVNWLFSQSQAVNLQPDGVRILSVETGYKWVWDISTMHNSLSGQDPPIYSSGMGMGAVGIINTLATYYQRTRVSDPVFAAQCLVYIQGALNYLDSVRDNLGASSQGGNSNALPETEIIGQNGDTTENSGYLSGAAGAAYMYLNLYQIFHKTIYLNEAKGILNWLTSVSGPRANVKTGIAWHIAIDPQDINNSNNAMIATGFEEGNAGIGWTFLQAYKITGDKTYLNVAEQAADWLLSSTVVISDSHGGYSWPEDYNPKSTFVHSNLDNGAAGIGMFLADLYNVDHKVGYIEASQKAVNWLSDTALHNKYQNSISAYWQDNDDGQSVYKADMSYHWGNAGIVAFLSLLTSNNSNKVLNIPGEEPALTWSN